MSTKLFTVVALLIAGGLVGSLSAQERIKAMFKKCETMEAVDINVVKEKVDGKFVEKVVTLMFNNNEALLNEFLAAFKADEQDATQLIERKMNGKVMPSFISFEGVNYSINVNGEKQHVVISQLMDSGNDLKDLKRRLEPLNKK